MNDSVFISYSRKDKEFTQRLASDLNGLVEGGVWFDQSDIHAGDEWMKAIQAGIRACKVFIFVLSPRSVASKVALEELSEARTQGKKIVPVIYQATKLPPGLSEFVRDVQYIDLRRGSYADNFQILVDALVANGVARQAPGERPFIPQAVKTNWKAVFGRIPSWIVAWGAGWAICWLILYFIALIFVSGRQGVAEDPSAIVPASVLTGMLREGASRALYAFIFPASGFLGGAAGGLVAGLITMLALRRHAPSISWKHVAPTIRIWMFAGIAGAIASVLLIPKQTIASSPADCSGAGFQDCLGSMIGSIGNQCLQAMLAMFLVILLFFVLVNIIWFVTGVVAGWLAVRHIRRLEPGIGRGQAFWVIIGWGLGGVVSTIVTVLAMARIASGLIP